MNVAKQDAVVETNYCFFVEDRSRSQRMNSNSGASGDFLEIRSRRKRWRQLPEHVRATRIAGYGDIPEVSLDRCFDCVTATSVGVSETLQMRGQTSIFYELRQSGLL